MKKDKNIYCLYFHINLINKEVFYVGIGNEKRPYIKSDRSEFWNKTVKKYGYEVKIVNTELAWTEACELEKFWIKKIGRRDLKEGTLVNLTDGGEGNNNFSDVVLKKISNTKTGVRNDKKVLNLKGVKFNKLTVVERGEDIRRKTAWLCNCECGNKNILVIGEYLKSNRTKSCGCINKPGLKIQSNIPIIQIDKETNKFLSAFESMTEASIKTGVTISTLQHYFKGSSMFGGGYNWKKITKKEFENFKGLKNSEKFKRQISKFDHKNNKNVI